MPFLTWAALKKAMKVKARHSSGCTLINCSCYMTVSQCLEFLELQISDLLGDLYIIALRFSDSI